MGSVAVAALILPHLAGPLGGVGVVGQGAAVAATVGGAYCLLLGFSTAAIFARAALALVPIGGLAVALILSLDQIDGLGGVDRRALIAAIVVAAGWVVGFVTAEMRRVGQEQERRRDLIRAVISEVELIASHGRKNDWQASIGAVEAEFQKDRRYQAFIFYGHNFATLRRLVDQIEVLRWRQIRSVMDLYQLLDRLDRMEDRIASDAFRALPWDRRQAGLVRFLTLQSQVPSIADDALMSLRDGPFNGLMGKIV